MKNIRNKFRSAVLDFKIQYRLAPRGRTTGDLSFLSFLTARHLRINPGTGKYEEIGRRTATRVVTDDFVEDVVDSLVAAAYLNDYKYHDSGTGVGGEAAGDSALGTPCGESRDTGTQLEGATAEIYKTVATHTYAGTFAITEHGVFDAASAGILMDRSVFSAINVVSSDQIEFTYELTLSAGG